MSCAYITFTETGLKLAERLALSHPGSISRGGKNGVKLSEWTAENFQKSDALIFIGAVGIVRNIGRERQQSEIITLRELENKQVDMFTTVYIGNKTTKNIESKMVTPRGYRTV